MGQSPVSLGFVPIWPEVGRYILYSARGAVLHQSITHWVQIGASPDPEEGQIRAGCTARGFGQNLGAQR